MSLGRSAWKEARETLQSILSADQVKLICYYYYIIQCYLLPQAILRDDSELRAKYVPLYASNHGYMQFN